MRTFLWVASLTLVGCTGAPSKDAGLRPPSDAGPSSYQCIANSQCTAGSICRLRDLTCVPVLSDACPRILGAPGAIADNALVIGALTPAGSGELGDTIERAVELAQREIADIPARSGVARPLVIVSCNELSSDGYAAVTPAANHLVKDLEVPVIVGPDDASNAATSSQVTGPNGVLMISPSAITSSLRYPGPTLTSSPLIWRLGHSDEDQLKALQAFITSELVPKLKADSTLGADEQLRIAIVTEHDFKGDALTATVTKSLVWNKRGDGNPATCAENVLNNPPGCIPVGFDNLSDKASSPETSMSGAVGTLLANDGAQAPPHVVLHAYSALGIPGILVALETAWSGSSAAGKPRPYHVGLFPAFNTFSPLLQFMDAQHTQLAPGEKPLDERMFAFAPRVRTAPAAVGNFVVRFRGAFPELAQSGTPFDPAPRAFYDATYMAAYALAAVGEKPVTGANVASTLRRLLQGPRKIVVGPTARDEAFSALLDSASIDLEGVSGDLALDPVTAAPRYYEVELSCPGRVGNKASSFVGSGLVYDPASAAMLGTGAVFDPTKTKCPYLN